MKSLKSIALLSALLIAAAGCTSKETLNKNFGNATAQNNALQIIDPVPADPNLPAPDMNGMRAAAALDRYAKGQVIAPAKTDTVQTGGGGAAK
jgi:hypothetical protein